MEHKINSLSEIEIESQNDFGKAKHPQQSKGLKTKQEAIRFYNSLAELREALGKVMVRNHST